MIGKENIEYLLTLPGWCSEDKAKTLYNLVLKCHEEFKGEELLTVELGVFGGRSLFPMAAAHKALKNGSVIGIDTWDKVAPLEGTNSPENNKWWSNLDIESIFYQFKVAKKNSAWDGYVDFRRAKSYAIADKFSDNSITILHQDSVHNVEVITKELEVYAPKIKMGGYWICDDYDWVETKAGYAKLPSYGFELVADYKTYAVFKKTGIVSEAKNKSFEIPVNSIAESKILSPIKVGDYFIQPVSIYLIDEQKWLDRYERAKSYFESQWLSNILWVCGIHAEVSGVRSAKKYMRDDPEENYFIPQKTVGVNLSAYIAYSVMLSHPEVTHWLFLEDDARFVDGWQDKLAQALSDCPNDFDYLIGGSCCCNGRPTTHIKGEVFEVKYPMCGHMSVIASKCLPTVLERQRNMSSPGDVEKFFEVFPHLKTYTILPRIAEQENTELPI